MCIFLYPEWVGLSSLTPSALRWTRTENPMWLTDFATAKICGRSLISRAWRWWAATTTPEDSLPPWVGKDSSSSKPVWTGKGETGTGTGSLTNRGTCFHSVLQRGQILLPCLTLEVMQSKWNECEHSAVNIAFPSSFLISSKQIAHLLCRKINQNLSITTQSLTLIS